MVLESDWFPESVWRLESDWCLESGILRQGGPVVPGDHPLPVPLARALRTERSKNEESGNKCSNV